MKCVKKDGNIKRVGNIKAQGYVAENEYSFCSKDEWKKQEKIGKYAPSGNITINGVKY